LLDKYKNGRNIFVYRNREETNKFLNELKIHKTGVT
jgi:hypothetical protein